MSAAPTSGAPHTRKRNRITLVCNVCKFRKVKCDRNSPCNSCKKYNTSDICSYTEPYNGEHPTKKSNTATTSPSNGVVLSLHSGSNSTSSIVSTNKPSSNSLFNSGESQDYGSKAFVGVNPIASPDDTINFHRYNSISNGADCSENCPGPFTWSAYMRLDPAMKDMCAFLTVKAQDFDNRRVQLIAKLQGADKAEFEKSFHWNKTPLQFLQRMNLSAIKIFNPSEYNINDISLPLGLNFVADEETLNANNNNLIEKILKVLPTKRIMWIHVNRFFKFIYPFLPILDEISFKESVTELIGEESYSDEKISQIKISKNIDFAILGMILIITRMSYLSLIANDKEVDSYNLNYTPASGPAPYVEVQQLSSSERVSLRILLENSIGIEYIVLARSCLNQFQLFQKIDLTILQLALLMRMYVFIAPEDSEGPDQNQFQTYTGTLISMAYSMGLHRDPEAFNDPESNPRINNLKRKIWFLLNYIDLFQSYTYGVPLTTNPLFSDCKFPYIDKENNNINITFYNLETHTLNSWKILEPIFVKLRLILHDVLNVNHDVSLTKLSEQLSDVEIFVANYMGTDVQEFLDAIKNLDEPGKFHKVLSFTYYIQLKFFLMSVYYHLFIYYEGKGNYELTYFYLKKIFSIIVEEFLPNFGNVLEMQHHYFGYACNLFLIPVLESAMHRCTGFMFGIVVRINYALRFLSKINTEDHDRKYANDLEYKAYYDSMEQLLYFCNKYCKMLILWFAKLGDRYLHSWRVSKCHMYILKAIGSDEFYNVFDFVQLAPGGENCVGTEYQKTLIKFSLSTELAEELVGVIYNALKRFRFTGGDKLREQYISLYGPLSQADEARHAIAQLKSSTSENFKSQRYEETPPASQIPLETSFSLPELSGESQSPQEVNIDYLFNMLSNKAAVGANYDTFTTTSDSDASKSGSVEDLHSVLESYYALDDPHFEIFNRLPLDKLFGSFDDSTK
ncbi:fungal-specific transcription factor domain-containing protein [Scheffersomyces amazonensis]|uniref:fungal-specific transcription factor domain-containing protein n=1 Tax=Scheffersomyces amazonensis TaxID=1078765 RepID=UPI00315DF38C